MSDINSDPLATKPFSGNHGGATTAKRIQNDIVFIRTNFNHPLK